MDKPNTSFIVDPAQKPATNLQQNSSKLALGQLAMPWDALD